jgi:DNA polymerase III alpha subunit
METKKGRVKNKYQQVVLSTDDLCELLLSDKSIDRVAVEDSEEVRKYKEFSNLLLNQPANLSIEGELDISVEEFHLRSGQEWLFPPEYQQIDIRSWLIDKCKTQEQISRVEEELELYEQKNLIMVLRLFIYLVDYMRKNGFVWGVGRGSSVASYVLYLIGIHRVDSLFYQLDIREYLK